MTDPHDADLYRLTYLSAARKTISQSDLDAILEISRENNRRHRISGMLIYHELQFFQTLEGAPKELDRVFTSIKKDARHFGCLMLERGSVAKRLFEGWAMAYKSVGELNAGQKQNFLDLTQMRSQRAQTGAGGKADTLILIESFLSSFRYVKLAWAKAPRPIRSVGCRQHLVDEVGDCEALLHMAMTRAEDVLVILRSGRSELIDRISRALEPQTAGRRDP